MHAPPRPNDMRQRLPVGTVLDGVYVIEGEIGSGGFGITYKGRDRMLGHAVAIKEYFPSDIGNRDSTMSVHPASQAFGEVFRWGREGFVREAQLLAGFKHASIVRVVRYFVAYNTAYMVLEYEEGRPFSRWLDQRERGGDGELKRRPPRQAELDRITAGLCDALAVIHEQRLIHRDIAPDNIIIRTDGSPVLLDFGAARFEVADQTRLSGKSAHTASFAIIKAHYSPFEQRSTDTTRRGPWSDIYALGATLYRAVVGAVPLDAADRIAGDSDQLVPSVEAAQGSYRRSFLEAIDRAMALKPSQRPQTIAAFRELALGSEAAGVSFGAATAAAPGKATPQARPVSFDQVPDHRPATPPPSGRKPARALAAAAAALLLMGMAGSAWWLGGRPVEREAASFAAGATQAATDAGRVGIPVPIAPKDAPVAPRQATADAEQARAETASRAEQQAAAERQAAEDRRQRQATERAQAEASRQAAEARRQREEADQARAVAARQAAEAQQRLEAERAETDRRTKVREQALLEQAEADRRGAEQEARLARQRQQAAEDALRREQAARAEAEARAAAEARTAPQTQAAADKPESPIEIRPAGTAESVAQTAPAVRMEFRANWSTKGDGYATTTGTTYGECEARCLADARCQSLEFFKPKRQCNLYADVPLDGASRDADVGIKRPTATVSAAASGVAPVAAKAGGQAAAPRITRQRNRFFAGDGYRKVWGSTFHACERLCLADGSCKAIELARKGNVCQLYATVPRSSATADADIGVRQ